MEKVNKRSERKKYFDLIDEVKKLNQKENRTAEDDKIIEQRWAEAKALKKRLDLLDEIEKAENDNNPIVPPKEKRNFSLIKAIMFLDGAKRQGYENEVITELERRGVSSGEGLPIPFEELFPRPRLEKRIVDEGNVNPELVDDPVNEALRVRGLYERSIVPQLGIKMISANGPFRFPTGTAVSAGWFSGSGGTQAADKISEQDTDFSETSLTPHFLGGYTSWSLRALKQTMSTVNLEGILRENLAAGIADKLDNSFLNGTDANQPSNFFTLLGATQNNTAKTQSTSSKWAWSDFVNMQRDWKTTYKHNVAGMPKFLMTAKDEALLRLEQRFTGTDGKSIAEALSYVTSGHCPDTKMVFGDWSQVLHCSFGAAEISLGLANDMFLRGTTALRVISCHDTAMIRKEAFRQFTITRA